MWKTTSSAAMGRRTLLGAVAASGSALATGAVANPRAASAGTEDVARAIERHGRPLRSTEPRGPLDDLAPFGRMIGDAVVVGLGEATHNSHEFFAMKHRVMRYLVAKGFGTFAQEVHAAAGLRINDYIRYGTGDIRQIMRQEFQSGTRLWNTREYLDLFQWMRAHNARGENTVQYMGNDIDYAGPELFSRVDSYVRAHHRALLPRLTALYRGLRPTADMNTWMSTYPGRPLPERQSLAARAEQALELLREQASGPDPTGLARVIQHARNISQVATLWAYDLTDIDQLRAALRHRELAMAANTLWWHEQTREKVLLSAHNLHVAYASVEPDFRPKMQGTFMREALGARYVSVGFTFNQGSFNAGPDDQPLATFTVGPAEEGFNEHTLDKARYQDYILDLRSAPDALRAWLAEPRPTRTIGAAYPVPPHPIALSRFHDVIIHLHRVRAAQLLS
jgi:erythromycin esterase